MDSGVARGATGAMPPKTFGEFVSTINLCCYVLLVCK